MPFFLSRRKKSSPDDLPPLTSYPPLRKKVLSSTELERLSQEIKIEQQRSLFQLAKKTVFAYFSVFVILSLMLLFCSLQGVDTSDFKWLISRFLEMTSPLVTAVVFYYFGNTKE